MLSDGPSDRRSEKQPASQKAARWEVRTSLRRTSPEEVAERFDELIHRRWHAAEAAATAEGVVLYEDLWIEMDLPGLERRRVKGRLEIRVERGSLRVRISKAPQS